MTGDREREPGLLATAIRPAMPADRDRLRNLAISTYVAAFGAGFEPSDLAAHLKQKLSPNRVAEYLDRDAVLIAESTTVLLGYVQFGEADLPGWFAIRRLYVTPSSQDQGLGSALMRAALADPRMQAAEQITLEVWEQNIRARKFYERFGFREIGRRPFVVASGRVTGYDLIMAKTSTGAA
jgi:ribosomal protein S18 acetylase RimI-like enzyme